MRMQLSGVEWDNSAKGNKEVIQLIFRAMDGPPMPSFARGSEFILSNAATVTVELAVKSKQVATAAPQGTWMRYVDGEMQFYLYEYTDNAWKELGRVNADGTPYK